jgi:hypothetical protein
MRYRNVVLYRALEDGPLSFALVTHSETHAPHQAGKPILASDGKTPLPKEEHLALVFLSPDANPRAANTAADVLLTAFGVRPAAARAGAPGWIGVDLVARSPARMSKAEFLKSQAASVEAQKPAPVTA